MPKISKFALLWSLIALLVTTPSFSQGDDQDLEELAKRHKSSRQQNPAMDNLEGQLDQSEQDAQEILKEMQAAMSPEDKAELEKAMASGDQEKITALSQKISMKMAKSGKGMDKMIGLALKGFQRQSPDELRKELMGRAAGSFFEPLLIKFPKLLDFAVNILRDPIALPQLFKIPQDRNRLLIFIGINIALIILAKIVKKIRDGKGALSRWIVFTSLRIGVLIFFFKAELTPAYLVFKKTFL